MGIRNDSDIQHSALSLSLANQKLANENGARIWGPSAQIQMRRRILLIQKKNRRKIQANEQLLSFGPTAARPRAGC
jgi:hypothetical protein